MALELYITNKGGTTCVALLGEFELAGVEQLQTRIARIHDDHARPVLDVGRVVVVDAASSEHGNEREPSGPGDLLKPVLDRVVLAIRHARRLAAPSKRERAAADDRLQALEKRIAHLEAMIEGLQDAVHREVLHANEQIDQLRKRTDPGEMSRALSRDARERGL